MEALYAIIPAVVALILVFGLRKRRPAPAPAPAPESNILVAFDEARISVAGPAGVGGTLRWEALCEVSIRTTDEGPWSPDVFWRLHDASGEAVLVIPSGATGEGELLEAMQARLPGFDSAALIDAMGCTDDRLFMLWQKEKASATVP